MGLRWSWRTPTVCLQQVVFSTPSLENIDLVQLEFDRGLSEGRNEIVKRVTTEYFWLMDDDFQVPPSTNMQDIFDIMVRNNLDILGGGFIDRQDLYPIVSYVQGAYGKDILGYTS
jgi:hypothetical protein